MSEKTATATLKKHMQHHGVFWQRIESSTTAPGIPDIFCCYKGRSFWLESKFKQLPKREGTVIKFGHQDQTSMQSNWMDRLQKAGGISMWWAKVGQHWYFFRGSEWLRNGVTVKELTTYRFRYSSCEAMVSALLKQVEVW